MLLVSFTGLFYFFGDFNKILYEASYSRIPLPFTDEFILGSYFARLFPIFFCLYLYFFSNKILYIIILSIITICCDVLIYISGERTAFALISISIIFLIFSLKKFRIIRFITLVISIFIITSVTLFNSTVKDRMIDQTISSIYNNDNNNIKKEKNISNNNINTKDDKKNKIILNLDENKTLPSKENSSNTVSVIIKNKYNFFSETHTDLAQSALKIYFDNNLFFGIGPKLFRFYCKKERYISVYGYNSCSTHPHYTYLQLLVETGFIGLIMILSLLFFTSFKIANHIFRIIFYKNYKLSIIEVGAYIGLFLTLCPLVPSGSFFNNWLNCIYYLPLIFIVGLNTEKNDQKIIL